MGRLGAATTRVRPTRPIHTPRAACPATAPNCPPSPPSTPYHLPPQALEQLESVLLDPSTSPELHAQLQSAALSRLSDDDLGVVTAALGSSALLAVPPAPLLAALSGTLARLSTLLLGPGVLPGVKEARKTAKKVLQLFVRRAGEGYSQAPPRPSSHSAVVPPPPPRLSPSDTHTHTQTTTH